MEFVLAKVLGIYFIAVSIALLLHPERIKKVYQQMMDQDAVLFLGGIMAVLFGAFIVSSHNIWVVQWPVIVTIVGWLSLIKGVLLMAYPDFSKNFRFFIDKPNSFFRLLGAFWGAIGLALLYFSWIT